MAPPHSKRGAQASGAPVAKKGRVDLDVQKCTAVAKGLQDGGHGQGPVSKVVDVLQFSMLEYKGHRHPFQQRVVDAVGDMLSKIEGRMASDVNEAQAALDAGKARVSELEAAVGAASASQEAAAAAAAERKRALADVTRTYLSAKRQVADAEGDRSLRQAELLRLSRERETLAAARTELLPLIDGTSAGTPANDVKQACKGLASFGIETSILVALPAVLGKAESDRSSFDKMVLAGLDQELTAYGSKLESEVGAIETAGKEAEAAGAERASRLVDAQARLNEAADAFLACQRGEEECAAAVEAAQQAVKEGQSHVGRHGRELAKLERQLEAFRGTPLAAFLELSNREAPTLDTAAPALVALEPLAAEESCAAA